MHLVLNVNMRRARDAGFDESKVRRDEDGKFSTTFSSKSRGVTHVQHGGSSAELHSRPDGSLAVEMVSSREEGRGHARELMKSIAEHLDARGVIGRLSAIALGKTDPDKLFRLYESAGFYRTEHESEFGNMVRLPGGRMPESTIPAVQKVYSKYKTDEGVVAAIAAAPDAALAAAKSHISKPLSMGERDKKFAAILEREMSKRGLS